MECPYCWAELICDDYYGKYLGNGHYDKTGDIYKCPNLEGFDDIEKAKAYQEETEDQKDLPVDEVCCDSSVFNGRFYTNSSGNLHEGYPC